MAPDNRTRPNEGEPPATRREIAFGASEGRSESDTAAELLFKVGLERLTGEPEWLECELG